MATNFFNDSELMAAWNSFCNSHRDVIVTVDRDPEMNGHRIKMENRGYEYIYRFNHGDRVSPSIFDIMYRSFMDSIAKDDESKHMKVTVEEPEDNWAARLRRQIANDVDSTE